MRVFFTILGIVALAWGASVTNADELLEPFRLEANGQPIDVGGIGYAAPFVGDFDGDGKRDLLVGQFNQGKMRVFLNAGDQKNPKFDEPIWFEAGGKTGRVPTG